MNEMLRGCNSNTSLQTHDSIVMMRITFEIIKLLSKYIINEKPNTCTSKLHSVIWEIHVISLTSNNQSPRFN